MIIPSISTHDTHLMKKDLKLIKHVNETCYYDNSMYDDNDGNDNVVEHQQPSIKKDDIMTKDKLHQLCLYNIIVVTLEQKLASSLSNHNNSNSNSSTSPTVPTKNTSTTATKSSR